MVAGIHKEEVHGQKLVVRRKWQCGPINDSLLEREREIKVVCSLHLLKPLPDLRC